MAKKFNYKNFLKSYSPIFAGIAFIGSLHFIGLIDLKSKSIEIVTARAGSNAVDTSDGKNIEAFMKPGVCPDQYPWGDPRQNNEDMRSRAIYYCGIRYASLYDPILKTPLWTHEIITKRDLESPQLSPRLEMPVENEYFPSKMQATLSDYQNTSYVPAFMASMDDMRIDDINENYETRKLRSEKAIKESAMMTNSVPMDKTVRDNIWLPLDVFTRANAVTYHKVYTISGPLYLNNNSLGQLGESKIAIPTHFYKIITEPSQHQTVGYIIPNNAQQACPNNVCNFNNFGVQLKEIERLTGFEFYSKLSPYYAAQVRKDPNEVIRKKQQELADKMRSTGK